MCTSQMKNSSKKLTMFMLIFMLMFGPLLTVIPYSTAEAAGIKCSAPWDKSKVYTSGLTASSNGVEYKAKWWTQGEQPGSSQVWQSVGACSDSSNPPVNQPPSVPANVKVTAVTDNSVTLSWTASTDDSKVASYTISYNGINVSSNTTAATITGLTAGTKYVFTIKAVDDQAAESGASTPVETTTTTTQPEPGNQPPTVPTNVKVTAKTHNSVSLSWNASIDDKQGVTYNVYYNGGVKVTPGTSVVVDGLAPSTKYIFTVNAKDSQGAESAVSTPVEATTDANPVIDPHEVCRPEGLYNSGVKGVPYCTAYDKEGREKLANNVNRRIIGYFTGWRTGTNGEARYIATDIPWNNITHINYAFAHIDKNNKVSVGSQIPTNPATGMEWKDVPEAAMDPAYPYKGHFNLLNKFKKKHPGVKTLVSIGGWAETGGYFDDAGNRVDSGGFYTMTTNADGTINQAGIDTFADSVVTFLRQYGFDGADIDYEYPTSMNQAGNPLDWKHSTPRLKGLNASYEVMLKTLRKKLDEASAQDGKYYMLTIASPSSGYLLRGMETFQGLKYLDYVNIMSYDLHGAWNEFVGPNAALFDDGKDAELAAGGIYGSAQYGGIGYLNTDWAYHYMRGLMQAGRINIGVPYYSRGFKNVQGGTNGLWGKSVGTNCPTGLTKCGDGAMGIDNLWHDKENGRQLGAGSNPMWHAMNLEKGIRGSYLGMYGLDKAPLTGTYTRHYDATLVAPWLWNADTKVFLSTEDEQSIAAKADYVIKNGIGGIMIWELAGDYDWYPQANGGKGEYNIGSTLTRLIHSKFKTAAPYGNKNTGIVPTPAEKLDIKVELKEFAEGDKNFPISPKLRLTNNSNLPIKGGSVIEFDIPTSAPANVLNWSGHKVDVIPGHTGNNVGGLKGGFHHVSITLSSWKTIEPGQSEDIQIVYYVPISGPTNYTITIDGKKYSINN